MQARRAIDNATVDSCARTSVHSPTLAVLLSAAVVVSLTTPAAAQAPSPQPATFMGNGNYYCGGYIPLPTLSGPGTTPSPPEACIVAGVTTAQPSITLAGSPGALVSTSASALTTSSVSSSVDTAGQIVYYMVITGGTGMSPVTVDLSAYLSASSSGNAAGGASLEIQEVSSPGTVVGTWNVCADTQVFLPNPCPGPTTIALQTTLTMSSNTLYVVDLMADAAVPGPLGSVYGTGTSSGFVDPSFGIDSTTPDAADYFLNFSAGIGNTFLGPPSTVTSVPEPGSLALLGAALVGLSAIGRRKRL